MVGRSKIKMIHGMLLTPSIRNRELSCNALLLVL